MATVNCCYKHSSKYYLFYLTEEITPTGLEQLEGEQIIKAFSFFFGEQCF